MSNLLITGVIDGPLSGGLPKAIEIYVLDDIADLSAYGLGSANNGGGSDGIEFTFPAVSAAKGSHLYVATEVAGFTSYFGFAPDFVSGSAASVNGDDAIELFRDGVVVDTFGDINASGTGTGWDYLDGWAYRQPGSQPSATFDIAQWSFSGINANDDQTSNAAAPKPFPIGTFATVTQPLLINEVLGSTVSTDVEYIELIGAPGQSLDGMSLIVVESDNQGDNGRIDTRFDFSADHAIGENGYFLLGNNLVAPTYGVTPNAEIPRDFIENSSYTIALVETASITGSAVAGTEVVIDAVGVTDGEGAEFFHFDAPVVGPDGSFMPAGFIRVTPEQGSDFILADFNNNPAVNTPTAGTGDDVEQPGGSYRDVKIHEVQGSTNLADGTLVGVPGAADESPLVGQAVRVQAIVTQVMPGLNGFYIQEEDADADDDAYSSEGVFIYGRTDVAVGDLVTIEGRVSEYYGQTQITPDTLTVDSHDNPLPEAVVIEFPTATVLRDADGDYVANLEAYEGMRVTIPQEMTVSELFQLDRFGTIRLTSDGRIETFTQNNAPSVEGYDEFLKEVASRSLVIDDGSNAQNPAQIKVPFLGENGVLSADDVIRMGDGYTGLTGIVGFSEDHLSGSEEPEYRIHLPTEGTLVQNNPRPAEPVDVGGSVKVAAFNVLNYFTTLSGTTGPANNLAPRGANNAEEFARQEAKLVAAIKAAAADVVGLLEIENDPLGSVSLIALTSALNAVGGNWGYVDAGAIEGAMGGALDGDAIKVGFIYNMDTIELNGSHALLDETVDDRFQTMDTQRPALAQTFTEKASGESFTAVINHFKSKSSAVDGDVDQLDGQGASANVRKAAAEALIDWLDTDPTGTGEDDILILGDLNSYRMEHAITTILAGRDGIHGTADDYVDLGHAYDAGNHSYVFDGMTGTLDYAIANGSLASKVTGAAYWNINADEADAYDYNLDFGRDPSLWTGDQFRSSDHEPIIVGLDFGTTEPFVYTLELLHMSDQEGNSSSIYYAPNASAVMNALQAQNVADATIRLSSGDALIPGVFYDASIEVFGMGGIADILIQNELGWQAITLGNHEFDKGAEALAALIRGDATIDLSKVAELIGTDLEGKFFTGTDMPYLSANLDFSTDAYFAALAVMGGGAPAANTVTSSVVLEEAGELIGVVGATTPTLGRISSPGGIGIGPVWAGTTPTAAELDALADVIQAEVDALLAANPTMNKVILQAHMQVINVEVELAARLSNVDIIVAGGSNTRLLDENDRLIDGDVAHGPYPIFVNNVDGGVTAVVNTDGNYKYVGRLVIDFDEQGRIIPESYDATVSGAYATDAQGVADLNAEELVDPEIKAIVTAIENQIIKAEGNVFGYSNVFLNGERAGTAAADSLDGVRTQETNLGNLTADANLHYARQYDETVTVSIKNGGGIRASIGEITVPAGANEPVRLPNAALYDGAGNVIKDEGGISQNDIQTVLAFNNDLSLVTISRGELVAILEHAATPGAGQFGQFSGVQFSYDAARPAGSRIINAAITDENGNDLDVLVRDGALVGNADGDVRVVALGFMVDGGDGYSFGNFRDRLDLTDLDGDGVADGIFDGSATFVQNGTEQDAFAEYLAAVHGSTETAYDLADTGRGGDDRIQNITYREDTVIDTPDEFNFVFGTDGRDILVGTDGNDIIISGAGNQDMMTGGAGADIFFFGAEALDGIRERDTIMDYEVGVDAIALGVGVTLSSVKQAGATVVAYLDDPKGQDDAIYIRGNGVTADNITFLTDYEFNWV